MTVEHLTLSDILRIHQDQLARYGGLDGVRDPGLLESSLAQPRATFDGQPLHPSLTAMAAAYLFHLVKNHPFLDGNKRTGAVAARVFLGINGHVFDPPAPEYEGIVRKVAGCSARKEEIASFIQKFCRSNPPPSSGPASRP
jgi:death-on-curing protein